MAETTRERLLDAAERLYAEHGIDATSLRAITGAAEANLASVHYHFGSKRALTEAVFSRRILPINRERIERLDQLESAAGDEPVPVESIVEVFILPALKVSRDPNRGGEQFVRLMGRMYTEPGGDLGELMARQFEEIIRRFSATLARALPDLDPGELFWRFHFMVGAMVHAIADPAKVDRLSGGLCDPNDIEGIGAQLVAFVSSGLKAPLSSGIGHSR